MASGCRDTEPLANGRTVIMYDQRGSGRSELVSDPKRLTPNHHVRDLEAVRQYLGVARMTLVGFSWGAGLAALYTMDHPEHVWRLLLIAPLPPARTPYWEQRLAKVNAKLGTDVATRVNDIRQRIPQAGDEEAVALCRELRVGYLAYLANPANLSRVRDRCDASPASIRNGILVSRATLDALGDWDFRPRLARLRIPTLVVEGAETEVPLEATREWAATLPIARLVLIPNAGHELWAEQRAAFLRAAGQFLGGTYPKEAVVVRRTMAR
jgi:proline iminopeptidase